MNSKLHIMGIKRIVTLFYAEAVWAARSSNSTRHSFTKLRLWRKEQQLRNGHALVGNGSTHVVLFCLELCGNAKKRTRSEGTSLQFSVEQGVAQFDPSCSATGFFLADPLSGGFHTTA